MSTIKLTKERANHEADCAAGGLYLLRAALQCFTASRNKQTAERVRLAISSAKGAVRICDGRATRAMMDNQQRSDQ